MKRRINIILIALLTVGNLYLFTKLKESNAALADANGKLNSIFLHTTQVKILDENTKGPVQGLTVAFPTEPFPSTEAESASEQHKILFKDEKMNVLSKVGTKPIKLKLEAPGYETKEIEVGGTGNDSGAIEILMTKIPNQRVDPTVKTPVE